MKESFKRKMELLASITERDYVIYGDGDIVEIVDAKSNKVIIKCCEELCEYCVDLIMYGYEIAVAQTND